MICPVTIPCIRVSVFGIWVSSFRIQDPGFGFRVSFWRAVDFRFQVSGSGFRESGSSFRVRFPVFGFRVPGFVFQVSKFGLWVSSFGFWVSDIRVRVWGFRSRVSVLSFQISGSGY